MVASSLILINKSLVLGTYVVLVLVLVVVAGSS